MKLCPAGDAEDREESFGDVDRDRDNAESVDDRICFSWVRSEIFWNLYEGVNGSNRKSPYVSKIVNKLIRDDTETSDESYVNEQALKEARRELLFSTIRVYQEISEHSHNAARGTNSVWKRPEK